MHRLTNQRETMTTDQKQDALLSAMDRVGEVAPAHNRRHSDRHPAEALEWEDPAQQLPSGALPSLVLSGKVIELGAAGEEIGFTLERMDGTYITVSGLTSDEARALAPHFAKKLDIAIGAAAELWGTSPKASAEYLAAQHTKNVEARARLLAMTTATAPLRGPDFGGAECNQCGQIGLHLCPDSASPAHAADLAANLVAVAVVGPAYMLRWCRADYSAGLKVGDNLFAFIDQSKGGE